MDGEIRMSLCYLELDIFSLQLDIDHLNKVEYDSPKANGVFVTHYLPPKRQKCSNWFVPTNLSVIHLSVQKCFLFSPHQTCPAEPQGLVGIRKRWEFSDTPRRAMSLGYGATGVTSFMFGRLVLQCFRPGQSKVWLRYYKVSWTWANVT